MLNSVVTSQLSAMLWKLGPACLQRRTEGIGVSAVLGSSLSSVPEEEEAALG